MGRKGQGSVLQNRGLQALARNCSDIRLGIPRTQKNGPRQDMRMSGSIVIGFIERGGKTPTPKISALLRKRPVLLRANFVLTKDRKRPYYGHFCGKMHREGACSKAAGRP